MPLPESIVRRALAWQREQLRGYGARSFEELRALPERSELQAPAELPGERFWVERRHTPRGGVEIRVTRVLAAPGLLDLPLNAKDRKKLETRFPGALGMLAQVNPGEVHVSPSFEMLPDGVIADDGAAHELED